MRKIFAFLLVFIVGHFAKAQTMSAHDQETYRQIDKIQTIFYNKLPERMRELLLNDDFLINYLSKVDLSAFGDDPKKFAAQLKKIKVPTAHQDKMSYQQLTSSMSLLKTLLKGSPFKFICGHEFKYASLYANDVNAEARNDVNGETVIFVNSRTQMFAYELSRLIIDGLTISEDENGLNLIYSSKRMEDKANNDPELQQDFFKLIESFYTGKPHASLPKFRKTPELIQALNEAMSLYIIAHEFAHAAYCHNLYEYRQKNGLTNLQAKKKTIASWRQEIAADIFAQMILEHYADQHFDDPKFYLIRSAGYIVLQSMEILERSKDLIAHHRETVVLNYKDPVLRQVVKNIPNDEGMLNCKSKIAIEPDSVNDRWLNVAHPPMFYRKNAVYTAVQRHIYELEHKYKLPGKASESAHAGLRVYTFLETLFKKCKPDILTLGTAKPSPQRSHEVLLRNAKLYTTAVRQRKYSALIDYIHPAFVRQVGGRIQLLKTFTDLVKDPIKAGPPICQNSVSAIKKDTLVGNTLFNVLSVHYLIKQEKKYSRINTHLVGVSPDEGRHWWLIDVGNYPSKFESVVPGISKLTIPPSSQSAAKPPKKK